MTVPNLRGYAAFAEMPVQPAELWRESGRFDAYGKEMLRITDRHEREMLYRGNRPMVWCQARNY